MTNIIQGDSKIKSDFQSIKATISNENIRIIGICGIPGSGKSTISEQLSTEIPNSIVIPLDGFHLYRKDLDEQGLRVRGAPSTFDLKRFKQKILELSLSKQFPIYFPSFDHQLKDPIEDDIKVQEVTRHIIIEGLYVFDKSLQLQQQDFKWGMKIFIDQNVDVCMPRVIKRCIEKEIEPNQEMATQRAYKSDKLNAEYVLANSDFGGCIHIRNPTE